MVLVIEGPWNPRECDKVYDALRHHAMYVSGAEPHAEVVVGVCSIDLKPGSIRMGTLQPEGKQSEFAKMKTIYKNTNEVKILLKSSNRRRVSIR